MNRALAEIIKILAEKAVQDFIEEVETTAILPMPNRPEENNGTQPQ